MLLKRPRLSGVLPRCGRLHLDFRDLNLDEIANGDEAYQLVSFHHRYVAEPARRHFCHQPVNRVGLPAVTTVLVMKSETGSFKTSGPPWPIARIDRAPTRCPRSRRRFLQ